MKNLINKLNNKYVYGFLFLMSLLALIDWAIFGRSPVNDIQMVTQSVVQTVVAIEDSDTKASDQLSYSDSELVAKKFNPQSSSIEEFKNWIASETQIMQQFNVNEEQIRDRFLIVTKQMSVEQFHYLAQTVIDKKIQLPERILASYLLGYSGYASVSDLVAVAKSPINVDGVPNAHSVAETQTVQERALRVLAINRLVDLAKGPDRSAAAKAKEELRKLILDIKDSNLKDYAESKFKEI